MGEHSPDNIARAVLAHDAGLLQVISIGTGSKCLPAVKLAVGGDALHDSHAEVIARRGAVRWLLEETSRMKTAGSVWLEDAPDGRVRLVRAAKLHLYVSTVPCGDASMRYLASFQDPEMAALKDSDAAPSPPANGTARGRNGYSIFGVLRTKPGRADSPPTLSMSCSDKIARWNVLGIQGAPASHVLWPAYISNIVIGEVEPPMRDVVLEDCERAFIMRLTVMETAELPEGFSLRKPSISFSSVPFAHSRTQLETSSSCNDSLSWVLDSPKSPEVTINGLRRGVPPKHRRNPKFRPLLSKVALFNLYAQVALERNRLFSPDLSYRQAKLSAHDYQAARSSLLGQEGPFSGWVKSGDRWDDFLLQGDTPLQARSNLSSSRIRSEVCT